MQKNYLFIGFGVLFVVFIGVYGTLFVPSFIHEKEREQKLSVRKSEMLSKGKEAGNEMVRQIGVEERRINSLPIERAEKDRRKQRMLEAAYNEMERVQASNYKESFHLTIP